MLKRLICLLVALALPLLPLQGALLATFTLFTALLQSAVKCGFIGGDDGGAE